MNLFSRNGPIGKAIAFVRELRSLQITTYAGYASFFILLSLFPTLTLILGLLRHTALELTDLMALLEGFLPQWLQDDAWSLLCYGYTNSTRTAISVSALAALWSAGKGIYGLMKGLNALSGVNERRGWLQTRVLCAAYMVAFLMVLLLTLVVHVFGNTLVQFFRYRGGSLAWLGTQLLGLRYFLLVAVQTMLFGGMYRFLPDRSHKFLECIPGALFSCFGWMTVSAAFSAYVQHFSGYTNVFGPVGTVAPAMLWLYVCVVILFYGGVLNELLGKIR